MIIISVVDRGLHFKSTPKSSLKDIQWATVLLWSMFNIEILLIEVFARACNLLSSHSCIV